LSSSVSTIGGELFGLDDYIASFSDGASVWIILAVAVLLGLRHATDPDHIAAVTTLLAGGTERASRRAAELGTAWGAGHALTLLLFGLPIVLLNQYLPERVQQLAETLIAVVIVALAARLLIRWKRGVFHAHGHAHGEQTHSHIHSHQHATGHAHRERQRTPLGAFAIGLVHGMGGSAGVGILIVASVQSTPVAIASLVLLAAFTGVSMTILSAAFGRTLESRPVRRGFNTLAPALGVVSLAFGCWYAAAAWSLAPYPF
jgi:ABC-type nickel/cobalt efflux system permease component RcnA